MDNAIDSNEFSKSMTIEEQAIKKYPMPPNACPWNKKKVMWLREKWIKEQSK